MLTNSHFNLLIARFGGRRGYGGYDDRGYDDYDGGYDDYGPGYDDYDDGYGGGYGDERRFGGGRSVISV